MLQVDGLYGHIRRNTLKSAGLLGGFGVLIAAYWYAACLVWSVFAYLQEFGLVNIAASEIFNEIAGRALVRALDRWWIPTAIIALWFAISWLFHGAMIRAATGARAVPRRENPALYNLVENVAITAGLPMPRVEIMETSALNAYAAGLTPATSTVAVTRGLLEALDKDELEAVIAHEITHIKNRDVRLMVIALIFAGGITFLGDLIQWFFTRRRDSYWSDYSGTGDSSGSGGWSSGGGGGGDSDGEGSSIPGGAALLGILGVLLVATVTMAISHMSALLVQLGISRSREFLADAGAAELTKNPDAMIRALQKISGHDELPVASEQLRAMMISRALDSDDFIEGLYATHPPIEKRIESLVRHAGGRVTPRSERRVRGSTARPAEAPADAASFAGARPAFGRRRAARIA
jgi:heat shock protein HtpX